MNKRTTALMAATTLASLLYRHHTAEACGGCFSPPETVTSVDNHRMVIALSPTKTVLWDQIRYTGNPADFVWVLPVPSADTNIAVANSEFFDNLEEQTAVTVAPPPLPPPPDCPPPPNGWSGSADAGIVSFSDAASVDVYKEEVVGPYQTVVVGSESANALYDWLVGNGYNVPPATLGVISHYTALGSKFVVLRLAPDQGVNAMQPVRVDYPGYMATFPLKMVTVGAYGTLQLTLWVFAEQRYEARNYGTVELPRDELVWDFAANRSNYGELFRATIDNQGGKAWIAESAMSMSDLWFNDQTEPGLIREMMPAPFLTRLRTDQLVDHLTQDLELAPSADSGHIGTWVQASQSVNTPGPRTCPDWDGDGEPDTWISRGGGQGFFSCSSGTGAGSALILVALAFLVARRRRAH
jgi:MYXO-CTERM domain-containing protein